MTTWMRKMPNIRLVKDTLLLTEDGDLPPEVTELNYKVIEFISDTWNKYKSLGFVDSDIFLNLSQTIFFEMATRRYDNELQDWNK